MQLDYVPPKLFISYSWTSAEHQSWVMGIAEELADLGVDVRFDLFHLKDGHDAVAFMESMVNDPEIQKVVIFSDKKYVESANNRKGGVGTETQIISPSVYEGSDPDKYVVVVCEYDEAGKACVPTYYKSRKFIDMTGAKYAAGFDALLRWVHGKPLHVPPKIGPRPAFLDDEVESSLGTSYLARRAIDAFSNGKPYALGALSQYFDAVAINVAKFKIVRDVDKQFDDQVVESISAFTSARDEILSVVQAALLYGTDHDRIADTLASLLERLLEYVAPPLQGQYNEWDADNFRFIAHEVFLSIIALTIKTNGFDIATHLLNHLYSVPAGLRGIGAPVASYSIFVSTINSLENRNHRLKLRRTSIQADLLVQRLEGSLLTKAELMQADLLLNVRARLNSAFWFPFTSCYMGFGQGTLPMFARAASRRYFEKVLSPLLGGVSIDQLTSMGALPSGFDTPLGHLNYDRLLGTKEIASKP